MLNKSSVDIFTFTSTGKDSKLDKIIDYSLNMISSGEETVVYVYPSVPDVLSASIFIHKLIEFNSPIVVRLEPSIDVERVKNLNLISIGIPLSKKRYDELAKNVKKALILGLCVEGLSKSKGNANIVCSTKYSGSAIYTWKILKEKLDALDYVLTLASLVSSNFFKIPKDPLEKSLISDAVAKQIIDEFKGVRIFGIHRKPLYKALSESLIPYLYGLTSNENASKEFVKEFGIEDFSSKLADHEASTIKRIIESILKLANKLAPNTWRVEDLIGEMYILKTPLQHLSDDLLEFSAQLTAISENLGLHKSVFIKEYFDMVIKSYIRSYYDTLRNVSKCFEEALREPSREFDVGGRRVKVVKANYLSEYRAFHMLESVILTSGYADLSDIIVFEGKEGFLMTYFTIKRVFLARASKAIEVLSRKSEKPLEAGFLFSNLRDIISSLRKV